MGRHIGRPNGEVPAGDIGIDDAGIGLAKHVFHMVFVANVSDPVALNNTVMMAGLLVYLTVSLGSVVALLLHFRKGR